MSTIEALAESSPPESQPAQSGIVVSRNFQRTTDWENPRVAAILETAAACFARKGFTGTTLSDICDQLGLRKSIVHYYFLSKTALMHEAQHFSSERYLDALRQGLDEDPSTEWGGLRQLWQSLKENPDLRQLQLELWSEGRRDPFLAEQTLHLQEKARELLSAHLQSRSPMSPERADQLARLTLVVLDGLIALAERQGSEDQAELAFESYLSLIEQN